MGLDQLLCIIQLALIVGTLAYWHLWEKPRKKRSQDETEEPQQESETASSAARDGGSANFSAAESQRDDLAEISTKEINDRNFYEQMLLISYGIGANYSKTRILKSLPGYSGDRHSELAGRYEGIKLTLLQSSGWSKMRKE
jgi:hypothetical protein